MCTKIGFDMVTIFIYSTMGDLEKEIDKSIGVYFARKLNKISNLENQKIWSLSAVSYHFIAMLKNET